MIQLGLAAGTLWDSPLGKAPNHTKSSLICWPLFIYLMKEILSYCEKEEKNLLKCSPFMCIILFFKVIGQLSANKEWADSC